MRKSGIYYGWLIVAACFVVTATLGETFFCLGIFFKPLENEFGWSRSVVSSCYTAFLIGYSISVIVSGRLADRYKPRYILVISGVLAGAGIGLSSVATDIHHLRLFMFIGGMGSGATLAVPTVTVQRWFYNRPRAGLALGIVLSGIGIGSLIFAPVINHLILTVGWRSTFLIIGTIFAAMLFAASVVLKESPLIVIRSPDKDTAKPGEETPAWPPGKALLNPAFIILVFAACAFLIGFQMITVHMVPYSTDRGISATAAATALGLVGALSIPGRLGAGFISKRLGWKGVLLLSSFGAAISIAGFMFVRTPGMLYAFVFVYGTFMGTRAVSQMSILGEFFGMRSLGTLVGVIVAVANIMGAVAPYFAGLIFDKTGSYYIAFSVSVALLVSGGFVLMLLKKPGGYAPKSAISRAT